MKDENETGATRSDIRDFYPVLTVTKEEREGMVSDGFTSAQIAEVEQLVNVLIHSEDYSEVTTFGMHEDGRVESDQMWYLRTRDVESVLKKIKNRKSRFYLHMGNTRSVTDIFMRHVAKTDWETVEKLKAVIREVLNEPSMRPSLEPETIRKIEYDDGCAYCSAYCSTKDPSDCRYCVVDEVGLITASVRLGCDFCRLDPKDTYGEEE